MPDKPEACCGWTVETLKTHFDTIVAELDKRHEQRMVTAALAADKAEHNAEKWRQNANEWRGAMTDRDAKYLTKSEFQGILKEWNLWRESFMKEFGYVKNRLTIIETKAITWCAAITVFFTIVQLAMLWILRK